MWRKSEPGEPQPSENPSSPSLSTESSTAARLPVAQNAVDSVGHGIRIKGEISGQGDLYWDGAVEGKIHISDGNLTLGPNARISAEIEAREIIVRGEVSGSLRGERVQVMSTGKVTGDVETRGIVIEDGAMLRSKVQVRRDDEPLQAARKPVVPRAKEAAASAGTQGKSQNGGL